MGLYWIQKRSSSANLRLRLSVFQQSQIHKIRLILSSSALPWFHTWRVRISVVWCRQDNGPISELPTETELMARACHYHCPEICYEFDMQKLSIPLPEGG